MPKSIIARHGGRAQPKGRSKRVLNGSAYRMVCHISTPPYLPKCDILATPFLEGTRENIYIGESQEKFSRWGYY